MSSHKKLGEVGPRKNMLPDRVRVSSGSAVVLGLIEGLLDAPPTTAYLLTYRGSRCLANCGFCSQARGSKSRADLLSRVAWPVFPREDVVSRLAVAVRAGAIKRICIQALNYPAVVDEVRALARAIRGREINAPISVSCQPVDTGEMRKLLAVGVERLGIALDAATQRIFDRVKGGGAAGLYDWDEQRNALRRAVEVFGKGKVSTHLIVGLGETEKEMVETVQWCVDNSVYPGLFSFTPVPGTALENRPPPAISQYRRIQLARYLIVEGRTRFEKMKFDEKGRVTRFGVSPHTVEDAVQGGRPFLTSGCPHCNRPYYNERPGGPLYNFPTPPAPQQIEEIRRQLKR